MSSAEQAQKFHTDVLCHFPDLGSTSHFVLPRAKFAFEPIRSTTRIWVVTRQRYRISAVIPQTSSYKATSGWGKEASIQRSLMYSNMAL